MIRNNLDKMEMGGWLLPLNISNEIIQTKTGSQCPCARVMMSLPEGRPAGGCQKAATPQQTPTKTIDLSLEGHIINHDYKQM